MSPINNLNDLNAVHIDVLREIGNIGSGSAATALSEMLGRAVDISLPNVRCLDFADTINFLGGAEELVAGLALNFSGEISGLIMYILKTDFVKTILDAFYSKKIDSLTQIDDMDRSAICEIGNIMAGSYVNALAELTGMTIDLSIPSLSVDFAGAIMSVPAVSYATLGDKVLFIDDNFKVNNGDKLKSNMIMVPDLDSLKTLFGKLGITV